MIYNRMETIACAPILEGTCPLFHKYSWSDSSWKEAEIVYCLLSSSHCLKWRTHQKVTYLTFGAFGHDFLEKCRPFSVLPAPSTFLLCFSTAFTAVSLLGVPGVLASSIQPFPQCSVIWSVIRLNR